MGGYCSDNNENTRIVSLPIHFSSSNYSVVATRLYNTNTNYGAIVYVTSKTVSSISFCGALSDKDGQHDQPYPRSFSFVAIGI